MSLPPLSSDYLVPGKQVTQYQPAGHILLRADRCLPGLQPRDLAVSELNPLVFKRELA